MADGTRIQEWDISTVSSTRSNPILADIFGLLRYMERQSSGFKNLKEGYHNETNFRPELEPSFYSDVSSFQVTLYNLNYNILVENMSVEDKKVGIGVAIENLAANRSTIEKVKAVYAQMGFDGIFSRSDISDITGGSVTSAGKLINKFKEADLIEAVSGYGKGKYRFIKR